jgi:hypothetical protein
MTLRMLLIVLALMPLFGCMQTIEPPMSGQESVLTPEQAKQALLAMMRSKPGQDLGWFDGDVPDEMAKMKVEPAEEGWYSWTGGVRFRPSESIYVITIQPQDDAQACTFEYEGQFMMKEGQWSASPPRLVSAAMPAGG